MKTYVHTYVQSSSKSNYNSIEVQKVFQFVVQSITLAAESLQSSLSRVRDKLTEPYQEIRVKVVQLKNLHSAVDLLRHILQSIKLTQRLRAHVEAGAAGCSFPLFHADLLPTIQQPFLRQTLLHGHARAGNVSRIECGALRHRAVQAQRAAA